MKNGLSTLQNNSLLPLLITGISIALGCYGLWLLFKLRDRFRFRSNSQQVDMLIMASANLVISILSITIVVTTQLQASVYKALEQFLKHA